MVMDNSNTFEMPELEELLSDKFLRPTFESIVSVQENQGSVPEVEGGLV